MCLLLRVKLIVSRESQQIHFRFNKSMLQTLRQKRLFLILNSTPHSASYTFGKQQRIPDITEYAEVFRIIFMYQNEMFCKDDVVHFTHLKHIRPTATEDFVLVIGRATGIIIRRVPVLRGILRWSITLRLHQGCCQQQ